MYIQSNLKVVLINTQMKELKNNIFKEWCSFMLRFKRVYFSLGKNGTISLIDHVSSVQIYI